MRRLLLPALVLPLIAAGCVSSGDVDLLHREITDVARQVSELGRQSSDKSDLQAMSQRLNEQSAQVLKSNADIQVELRELRDQIESLQASLETTSRRLEALTNELAATRGQAPGAAPGEQTGASDGSGEVSPAVVRPSEPAQLYSSAYEDYLRGNFDLAIQGFQDYVKRYPSTELSDNALYWIGESHYSQRRFDEAVAAFTELLNTYKASDKGAAALLKKGLAFLEKGDRSQAVINLQYVLYEHPGTKEAELARNRLAQLGVKVR